MPNLFSFASHATDHAFQEMGSDNVPGKRARRPSLLRKPLSLLRRHQGQSNEQAPLFDPAIAPSDLQPRPGYLALRRPSLPHDVPLKRAVPSLPRPQTFRRQESERRERLLEVPRTSGERRTLSADRRRSRGLSASAAFRTLSLSPAPPPFPSISASNTTRPDDRDSSLPSQCQFPSDDSSRPQRPQLPPLDIPENFDDHPFSDITGEDYDDDIDKTSIQEEFDRCWILNLSMHFRDKSNREKFFVTYAEKPNQWRRITISLDYRDAPEESLEANLSTLHLQRDKSFCIYEAIRESLPDIQYYDTVTNLKLQTTPEDGQLHVHVREDANEIVQYPSISLFKHVRCQRVNETSLEFDSHLSGFVYKVRVAGRMLIKKEIPGPDTVDEFLYEVNALDALLDAGHVVHLEGLVTDDRGELVKGLLISYASQGALVDMIYDFRKTSQLPWHRREKWAKQVVSGLSAIHEAGFVQGDFTLSNIVIDDDDNAKIIDINRRGCPVGWEPPELGRLIDSGQRIGMCIGVKTDIFQLGMVLWALAEQVDEPERVERPLEEFFEDIPVYYREIVRLCLSERPQDRLGAKQLLERFPSTAGMPPTPGKPSVEFKPDLHASEHSDATTHRSAREYIDPQLAVTIEEIRDRRRPDADSSQLLTDSEQVTYVNPDSNPASSTYRFDSSGSWIIGQRSRGRSPVSSRRRRSSPYGRAISSATSLSANSPTRRDATRDDGAHDAEAPKFTEEGADSDRCAYDASRNAVASVFARAPFSLVDKRLAAVQSQNPEHVSQLVHTDSGFDEFMDDLDLDDSHMTETSETERPKTYVLDDEPSEHNVRPLDGLTGPGSFHTALVTPTPDSVADYEETRGRDKPAVTFGVDAQQCNERRHGDDATT